MDAVSWGPPSRQDTVGQACVDAGELARRVARGDHRELAPHLDRNLLRRREAQPQAEVVPGLVDLLARARQLGLADAEVREEVESAPVRIAQDRVQAVRFSV